MRSNRRPGRPPPPDGRTPHPGRQTDPGWGPVPDGRLDGPGRPSEGRGTKRRRRNLLVGAGAAVGILVAVVALAASVGDDEADLTTGTAATPRPTTSQEPAPTPTTEEELLDSDGGGTRDDDEAASAGPGGAARPTAVVAHVVDGDTIDVEGVGRIRIIGIDTPERGECGYQHSTDLMRYLVLGKEVTLVPGTRDDRDSYGRLLRYVDVDGRDAGREMIGSGWAIARYDSRDGYGGHPREAGYVQLDTQVPDRMCAQPPRPAPAPAPGAPAAEPWNLPGPDLDCSDIRRKVAITAQDHHRLDPDGDGWGCESYG